MPERQIEGKKLCQSVSEECAEDELDKSDVTALHLSSAASLELGVQLVLLLAREETITWLPF